MRQYSLVGCFALAIFVGCDEQAAPPAENSATQPTRGESQPVELKVLDFDGIQKLIASHRGKVVVMDAWATSCPPCVTEFPHLVELHERFGDKGLACISLSFDYEGVGKPEDVREEVIGFLQEKGATFDNVLASIPSLELYRSFDLAAVPAVFVYDQQGKLVKRFEEDGPDSFSYADVELLVTELLAVKN